jgi:hypothetical protein
MKLQIDNLDGAGPQDYTAAIDSAKLPQVIRKLNQVAQMRVGLVANSPEFTAPGSGARVTLSKANGQLIFTGYLASAPEFEYAGWGERGAAYRYSLTVLGDEALLNRKRLPQRAPFVERTAGSALRQLAEDLLPGVFDTSGVEDVDTLAEYAPDPQKTWAQHAAEISLETRAAYRVMNGAITLAPVGAVEYALNETDSGFAPEGLKLQPADGLINDVTVVGNIEPQDYVTDYFVGDGLTLKFYLSQTPFTSSSQTVVDEEYLDPGLDATRWALVDPAGAVSVTGGKLQIAGGTGVDGATTVEFVEKIELGGAVVLQHGNAVFSAASAGVLGGLYAGAVSIAGCLAGFQVTPNGTDSNIQALVNGLAAGTPITTTSGHQYVLTTRLYSQEIYRRQQTFHSAAHAAGNGRGGAEVASDVRVVLEVHEIDPANPATQVAPSTVLYDGVIASAPDFCNYALVNAANLQCSIAFSEFIQAADAEVRSALPGESYSTRLVGPLSNGAECNIVSGPALDFFTAYVPAPNELIEVHYRGRGRATARVTNPVSITAQAHGTDDGVRSVLRHVKAPEARTSVDCENAALAVLDDATGTAWSGQYDAWSDFLPAGAADIFPGDGLQINAASRGAAFGAIVNEVDIAYKDLAGEHSRYTIKFAGEAATALAFAFEAATLANLPEVTAQSDTQVGDVFLGDLTAAEVTQVTSTTISVDAGAAPPAGGGIEVRWSDLGWGAENDRNLVGRFATQTFTIPRLSRAQTFYLQQYDGSVPPKYSRYSASLHVDYPL